MKIFLYDHTFSGMLTAVDIVLQAGSSDACIAAQDRFTPDLFREPVAVKTNEKTAELLSNRIAQQISPEALRHVYRVFLSEVAGAEDAALRYIRRGFAVGPELDRYLTDDDVKLVHDLSGKVSFECHRILGLLRFRELRQNVFYAPFEPDYNIVSLVAPHFARRMADQNWIIHDRKRQIAAFYDQNQWTITRFEMDDLPYWEGREYLYQDLWRQFFQTIAIRERRNPRLQRQHMPQRYWQYLVEMDE